MFDIGQKEAEIAELQSKFDALEASRKDLEEVQITDIEERINEAKEELEEAEEELREAKEELRKVNSELDEVERELLQAEGELEQGKAENDHIADLRSQLAEAVQKQEEILSAMTDALLEGNEDLRNELEIEHDSATKLISELQSELASFLWRAEIDRIKSLIVELEEIFYKNFMLEQQKAVHSYICNLIDSPGASSSELEALKIRRLKTQIREATIKEHIVEEKIKKVENQLKECPLDRAVFNKLPLYDKLIKQKNKICSTEEELVKVYPELVKVYPELVKVCQELVKVCQQLEENIRSRDEIYSAMTDALLEGNEDLRNELEIQYDSVTELIDEAMIY